MIKVVENPEIEKLLNDNIELVTNEAYDYWKSAVAEDCWIGGFEEYIPYFFEWYSIDIDDEYIEFDDYEIEVDVEAFLDYVRFSRT